MRRILILIPLITSYLSSFAQWEVVNFVNDFGEKTNLKMVRLLSNSGSFENSELIEGKSTVLIAVSYDDPNIGNDTVPYIKFKLWEYNKHLLSNDDNETKAYIKIKYNKDDVDSCELGFNGSSLTFFAYPFSDELVIRDKFVKGLKKYASMKAIICLTHFDLKSVYRFNIDCKGFSSAFNKLKSREKSLKKASIKTEF